MNETLGKKFRFFSEVYPDCNANGKYYASPGEVYLLRYLTAPLTDGCGENAFVGTQIFTKIEYADKSIREYMRSNPNFKSFTLIEMNVHDWGVVYIGKSTDHNFSNQYVKFVIRFESVLDCPTKFL
jgi:hypothetical protein